MRVDVVVCARKGAYADDLPESIRIVDLQASRVIASFLPLVRYLRDCEPTVLLSGLEHANIIALLAHRTARSQSRIIVTVHNMISINSRNAGFRERLMPTLARRFYRWADHVIAVSRGVGVDLAEITGLPEDRISIVHNPVIVPEMFERAGAEIDHPWFDQAGPPVIISVGRLTAQKGYPALLQAIAKVRERLPVRLLILGEGEDRPALESLADELRHR